MRFFIIKPTLFLCALLTLLTACSPRFDWRDVHDGVSPCTILLPGKPAKLSREIRIGQQTVTMYMTATQIDSIKFALGAAKMTDATQAQASLAIIKNALLQNISGQLSQDKTSVTNGGGIVTFNDEFEAAGTKPATRMLGRLVAHDVWVYQLLVVGPGDALELAANREAAETFLNSFKPVT